MADIRDVQRRRCNQGGKTTPTYISSEPLAQYWPLASQLLAPISKPCFERPSKPGGVIDANLDSQGMVLIAPDMNSVSQLLATSGGETI